MKFILNSFLFASALSVCTAVPDLPPFIPGFSMRIYASTYNGIIQLFDFTPPSTLTPGPKVKGDLPSWLVFAKLPSDSSTGIGSLLGGAGARHLVYCAEEASSGIVYGFEADPETGELKQLEPVGKGLDAGGDGTVALTLTGEAFGGKGESCLWTANYGSGTVGVIPISSDGALAPNSDGKSAAVFQFTRPSDAPPVGPVKNRQDHSYAHQVVATPDGAAVAVMDLGADQVHFVSVGPSKCSEAKVLSNNSFTVPAGSGPRHIAFWPPAPCAEESEKTYAYLALELTNEVMAFEYDARAVRLRQLGEPLLAAPPGTELGGTPDDGAELNAGEIAVSPDGRFVYVSNRRYDADKDEDRISIFARDPVEGTLRWLEWTPSGGKTPRHFSLSNDPLARYLAVGSETSGNLTIFERDPLSGKLSKTGAKAEGLDGINFAGFAPF